MTTISDLTTWTYVEVINTRWGGKVPLATRLVCGRPGPRPTQCGSEQGVFQAQCGSEQGVLEIFRDNVTHLGGWWAFVTRHLNLKKSHGGDQHQ